jgi:hypothetical protein
MALITTNRLFIDVDLNRSYSQFGTFNISSQPFFIQGDQCPVEINLVRQTGLQANPFVIVTWPVGATFSLKLGTPTAVATSTTTATIPAGPSAATAVTTPYAGNNWQVNRVVIEPAPLGGNFTINNGTVDTSPISVFATAANIRDAIIASWGAPYDSSNVNVVQVSQFAWDISFNNTDIGGVAITLTLGNTGMVTYDSRLMQLDMTTAGVATLLGSNASVEATLEFSIEVSGEVQTFLLTPCTVINDL